MTALLIPNLVLLVLLLARVSGLLLAMPIYGRNDVPWQVRGLLAFALAVVLWPTQLNRAADVVTTPFDLALHVALEMLLGIALGLGAAVVLAGLQLAGQIVAQMAGLALAEVYNPSLDVNTPVLGSFIHWAGLAVFLSIGGHRLLVGALLHTLEAFPPGAAVYDLAVGDAVVRLVTESLSLGIRAAAPATVALLLGTLVVGLLGRTLPQLNVMALGFGLNALITFGTLIVSLASIGWLVQEYGETALRTVVAAIAPGNP